MLRICLGFGISHFGFSVLAAEKESFELPEVTIMGKDFSEYETPDTFTYTMPREKKGEILHREEPGAIQEQETEEHFRTLSASGGRYGTIASSADLAGRARHLDYLLQWKYARTDGYRDHAAEDFVSPSAGLGIQVDKSARLWGDFGYFRKRMELPGPVDAPTPDLSRRNDFTDFDAGMDMDPVEGQRLKTGIYGKFSRTEETPGRPTLEDSVLGLSSTWVHHELRAGVDFYTEQLDNFYSARKVSGYGGVSELPIGGDLFLESILHVDYYEGMAARLHPRAALVWEATHELKISGGAGKKMHVRDWSGSYLSEYYVEGNREELRPQRELEGFLAASYILSDEFTASLSLFQRESKDHLVWQDADGNGLFSYVNQSEVLIRGLSLELQSRLWNSWTGRSRLTFQDPEGEGREGRRVPYVPGIRYDFGLDWKGPAGFGIGTDIAYVSSQYIDFSGSGQIQDYVLWDVVISYEWQGFTVFGKFLNVLDQRYDYYRGYPGPDTQYQFGINIAF